MLFAVNHAILSHGQSRMAAGRLNLVLQKCRSHTRHTQTLKGKRHWLRAAELKLDVIESSL